VILVVLRQAPYVVVFLAKPQRKSGELYERDESAVLIQTPYPGTMDDAHNSQQLIDPSIIANR
jgi:hypothetical protein